MPVKILVDATEETDASKNLNIFNVIVVNPVKSKSMPLKKQMLVKI